MIERRHVLAFCKIKADIVENILLKIPIVSSANYYLLKQFSQASKVLFVLCHDTYLFFQTPWQSEPAMRGLGSPLTILLTVFTLGSQPSPFRSE